MEKVVYKPSEIRPIKAIVHNVRIISGCVEVTFTDGEGHYWFETYDEKQLEDYIVQLQTPLMII